MEDGLLERLLDERFQHINTKLDFVLDRLVKSSAERDACQQRCTAEMSKVDERLRNTEMQVAATTTIVEGHEKHIMGITATGLQTIGDASQWSQARAAWVSAILSALFAVIAATAFVILLLRSQT